MHSLFGIPVPGLTGCEPTGDKRTREGPGEPVFQQPEASYWAQLETQSNASEYLVIHLGEGNLCMCAMRGNQAIAAPHRH